MAKKKAPSPPPAIEVPRPPDFAQLSSKHRETARRIFERPNRSDIPWRDIEGLFRAMGAIVAQGNGSRVRVALGGRTAVFHEPHPEKVTDKGAVTDVRGFLVSVGFIPR